MLQKLDTSFFLALDRGRELRLNEGDTVDVRILSKQNDGTAKIGLRSFSFTAKAPPNIQVGQTQKMLVSFKNNQLVLTPILPSITESAENFSSKIATLPDTTLANSIVDAFMELNLPLNFSDIRQIYTLLESTIKLFENKQKLFKANEKSLIEKRLSFLAVAMKDKNILLTDKSLQKVYRKFFGDYSDEKKDKSKNGQTEYNTKSDKEQIFFDNKNLLNILSQDLNFKDEKLLKLFNHTKGSGDMTWVLFPFEKKVPDAKNDKSFLGSVAFLLNLKTKTCVKTIVRANVNFYNFIFEIKNNFCNLYFEDDVNISEKEKNNLIKKLEVEMNARNLNLECRLGKNNLSVKPLNLEV